MSKKASAVIRYDGPALTGHEMDVQDLAPALMALGELCKAANYRLNGNRASVKVLVNADIEQQCFQLSFEIVQTFLDAAKDMLGSEDVKTAKDIAEWIGLVGGGSYATVFGLYKLLAQKRRSHPESVVKVTHGRDVVTIQVTGDSNVIEVKPEVFRLATDPKVLEKTQAILRPLSRDGYDSLEFYSSDGPIERFDRADAEGVMSATPETLISEPEQNTSTITTTVGIHSPVYEGHAQWELIYKKVIRAAIEDEAWLDDFQNNRVDAPPNCRLKVSLEERWPVDKDGMAIGSPTYVVKHVFGVVLPQHQMSLDDFGAMPPSTPPAKKLE